MLLASGVGSPRSAWTSGARPLLSSTAVKLEQASPCPHWGDGDVMPLATITTDGAGPCSGSRWKTKVGSRCL